MLYSANQIPFGTRRSSFSPESEQEATVPQKILEQKFEEIAKK